MAAIERWPLIGALLLTGAPALAQDVAQAEALFNHALDEMKAGHFDAACPAFAESQRVDPRPGTLFTLAECENKRGRIATAVARYDEYARLVATLPPDQQQRQRQRLALAAKQKAAIEPDVPWLTLTLRPGAPAGTVVTRDGVVVGEPALGVPLPIDPGEHVLAAQAPGAPATEVRQTIGRGQKIRVELSGPWGAAERPPEPAKPAPQPKPAPPPEPKATEATPEPRAEPAPAGHGETADRMRVAGWSLIGIGGVGVLVGAVTGLITLSARGTVSDNCTGTICNQDGLDAANRGKAFGTASTVGFAVGAPALIAGVVLVPLAARYDKPALTVAPTAGGASLVWRAAW